MGMQRKSSKPRGNKKWPGRISLATEGMTLMGEVIQLRPHTAPIAPDAPHAIGLAYQQAAARFAVMQPLAPRDRSCRMLLERIVDSAARGMRDVDQLREDALAHLMELSSKAG